MEEGGRAAWHLAQHHPRAAELHALAQEIARLAGASLGFLGEAANSVGAYLAGAVPFAGVLGRPASTGMNAAQMLAQPRLAYLLLNTEIELDCHDPQAARAAMEQAELVVALSAYRHDGLNYADVMLPVAPFSETSGTFVNTEGRAQSFNAAVKPLGEARPAWRCSRSGQPVQFARFRLRQLRRGARRHPLRRRGGRR